MVYIFHVEKGVTHILPMNIVVENVTTLKTTLAGLTGIDTKRQVLLISGGEVLVNERKVGSYHAGTDTNPIFLFNAGVADVGGGISSSASSVGGPLDTSSSGESAVSYGNDALHSVDAVLNMPLNSSGVAARVQLAQGFRETALKDENLCRRLVQQQHMQHQGWAAVIANLEDCTAAFMTARTIFEKSYRRFAAEKDQRWPFIQSFIEDDMSLLRRIPIFICFASWRNYASDVPSTAVDSSTATPGGENLSHFRSEHFTRGGSFRQKRDEELSRSYRSGAHLQSPGETSLDSSHPAATGSTAGTAALSDASFYSMLEWINQAGHCTVESLVNNCFTALHAIDESDVLEDLLEDSAEIADCANATEMKQVKGLSDRLFGLEQLQIELSKLAKLQTETVQAFVQSCSTMHSSPSSGGLDSQMTSRDISFMPSASSSPTLNRGGGGGSRVSSPTGAVFIPSAEDARQTEMLRRMQHAHKKIGDIRARCASAKDELCINLSSRLKWVVFVERNMAELNAKLAMHIENFKRIKRAFLLLEQIHDAPRLYVIGCYEIVRRKRFSTRYEQWARTISERAHNVWQRECTHRRRVAEQLEEHFLRSVVDGLFYDAPQFAQNVPTDLTRHLPATLGEPELVELRQRVPELCELVEKDFGSDESSADLLSSSSLFSDVFTKVAAHDENSAISPTHDSTGSGSDARTTTMIPFVLGGSGSENRDSSTADAVSGVAAHEQQANTSTSSANDAEVDELDNDADGQSVEQFELWHGDGESEVLSSSAAEKQRAEPPSDAEVEHYVAVTLPSPSAARKSVSETAAATDAAAGKSVTQRRFMVDTSTPVLARSTSIDAVLAFPNKHKVVDTERLVRSAMQPTTVPMSAVNFTITDIVIETASVVQTVAPDGIAVLPATQHDSNAASGVNTAKPGMVDAAVETTAELAPPPVAVPETTDFSTQTILTGLHLERFASKYRGLSAENRASATRDSLEHLFLHFVEQVRVANVDLQQLHQEYITEADEKIRVLHSSELRTYEEKLSLVKAELHEANQNLGSVREQLRTAAISPSLPLPPQVAVPSSMETSMASIASSARTASLPRSSGGNVSTQLPSFVSTADALPPRVSVLTCQVDDLVFAMFNPDVGRFVVFQLNRVVPFIVDPKSYAELGITDPVDTTQARRGGAGGFVSPSPLANMPVNYAADVAQSSSAAVRIPGSAEVLDPQMLALIRAPPVIAQVVRKDYCVATKAPNRYRMPLDSKFYRVRLKKFDASAFSTGNQQQNQRPSYFSRQSSVLSSSVSSIQQQMNYQQQQQQSNANIQSVYYASSPGGSGADPSWMRSL